eukprot:3560890-Pyramimonas_sp.AAC.1
MDQDSKQWSAAHYLLHGPTKYPIACGKSLAPPLSQHSIDMNAFVELPRRIRITSWDCGR